jgi:hypothetical protein
MRACTRGRSELAAVGKYKYSKTKIVLGARRIGTSRAVLSCKVHWTWAPSSHSRQLPRCRWLGYLGIDIGLGRWQGLGSA